MHTPVDVTLEAVEYVLGKRPDCMIANGGGSTTGLGTAIALHMYLVHIMLPRTFAGSEGSTHTGGMSQRR
jgi:maleylacetate reductase